MSCVWRRSSSGSGGGGSGSGGGSGNTPSSKNPFGVTEKDNHKYFCLDKGGKVLRQVESEYEGEDVEGTVFVVYWDLTDGTGKVELCEYYGDDEDVTIPNGVTAIRSAFVGCTSLASVNIPGSVTEIGGGAFGGCTSLASVTIPGSVTKIGDSAFDVCTLLASVTIPGSVTTIGDSAFKGCKSLASVTIPDGVTSIDYSAFEGCTSLTSMIIPGSVTRIGSSAFKGCTSLMSVTFIEKAGWHANSVSVTSWDPYETVDYSEYDIEDMSNPSNNAEYLKHTYPHAQPNDPTWGKKDWGARTLFRKTE